MMSDTSPLRGYATVNCWAAEHVAARSWYAELLGIEPYFERPGYCAFRIGEHQAELGIVDSSYAPAAAKPGPGGEIIYWHVDDVNATFERLLAMGATQYEPPTQCGAGFFTASVVGPFGNILGIMYNRHTWTSVLDPSRLRGGNERAHGCWRSTVSGWRSTTCTSCSAAR